MSASSNVPQIQWTENGLVVPQEADILTGRFNDFNNAFGGNLRNDLSNPVGQLTQSEAAIIGNKNNEWLNFIAGIDPRTSTGRMQDGIGQLYYLTRIAASPTIVTARCYGLQNTLINADLTAQDQAGNVYVCLNDGIISGTGYVDLTFSCSTTGPISCPIGYLNRIYKGISGWDSITNLAEGTPGTNVETPQAFEYRRQQSVALNAQGSLSAILANVLNVSGVTDAFTYQNTSMLPRGASFTGSISGTTLTVTAISSGIIEIGMMVTGVLVEQGQTIISAGTGVGGIGTYNLSISQSLGSTSLHCGFYGVYLLPHSIYVAAYGGNQNNIAQAIFNKMSPGCDFNGNTNVTIYDNGNGLYTVPYPSYLITYQIPIVTPILFNVSMQQNSGVPANAISLVKQAIIDAFNGLDEQGKARIASTIFASRYYSAIINLGAWAHIYSVQLGVGTANKTFVAMQMDQIPTLSDTNITVTFT